MQANTIQLDGTVKRVFTNESKTFTALNVECDCGRDRLWADLVGFKADAELLANFEEGDRIIAVAHPASNKDAKGTWRVRFILDEVVEAE